MSRVDIFLDNYVNGYRSGQSIVGRVQCKFTDEKTVKGLVLKFKGTAKTSWTETESYTNHDSTTNSSSTETRTVYYGDEESILHHELNLLPQAEQTIPSGVHNYPFSYVLPVFIPSTFDGLHGKIVYKVKATVRRPTFKMDYEAESPINVIGMINLNDNSTLSNPIVMREEKNIGCCCWKSGPFKFEWNLPYTGFIPGQNIPINIEIENLSNDSVEKVKCKINERIIFKDKRAHKTEKSSRRITDVELGGVGAHGERTYHDIFPVPGTLNPPNFQGCSIMEVHHTLTVEAVMPSCTRDIEKTVPITIGHIPLIGSRLDNQYIDPVPSYNSTQVPSAPLGTDMSNMATAPSFNAPPYPTEQPAFGWKMPSNNPEAPPPNYDDDMVIVEKPAKS